MSHVCDTFEGHLTVHSVCLLCKSVCVCVSVSVSVSLSVCVWLAVYMCAHVFFILFILLG